MALITFVGLPSAGKSTRANQLFDFLQSKINPGSQYSVKLISDHSLNIPASVYDDSASEKPARGTIFTAVQRAMAPDTILILDSLNYIKGFRYQLYCAARELKLRTCTVFVVATPELCAQWNQPRDAKDAYKPSTLEGLCTRFEEPSSMVRWDAPLFTVLWTDESVPGEEIWQAITHGVVKPPNAGTLAVAKAPGNALQVLESTTSAIVSAVLSETASKQGIGGPVRVRISETTTRTIELPNRTVTMSELQRMKRQFITIHKKAVTLGSTERGAVEWGKDHVAEKFGLYLKEHLVD